METVSVNKPVTTTLLRYIPSYFTGKGIVAFLGLTIVTFLLFLQRSVPIQWFIFNLIEVWLFFAVSSTLSRKWSQISITDYTKQLFRASLIIRLIWVVFSYFFYSWTTGQPFEFYTGDAFGYHSEGAWLAGLLHDNKWDVYSAYIAKNYSDMGYPFYLGLIYYVTGPNVLIPRLIKAVLGAYTCLFTYKLARNNFGESTGRMAGVMAMLVPNLIYYCGLHVKETEMVFLTVWFIYQADMFIRSPQLKPSALLTLGLLGASLFFFRTVLAGCLVGSMGLAAVFTSRRISAAKNRERILIIFSVIVFLLAATPLSDNIDEYLKASDQNLTSQMDNFATREDGANRLARYGSRTIFLPFMLLAPFPTLVYVADQPNAMMLAGAYFTRNVYAFFVFIALFVLYQQKRLRDHILILAVIFSYIFVLASSGFALSERFHLPLIPFLLILAAFGVSQVNQKNKKYYIPYLILVSIIIVGWNWFKLAGRA